MIDYVPITVVTDKEAEKADYVICMRAGSPSPFTDNEVGRCCACDCAVIFRPSSPKSPPRICLECATEMMARTVQ